MYQIDGCSLTHPNQVIHVIKNQTLIDELIQKLSEALKRIAACIRKTIVALSGEFFGKEGY